MKRLVKRILSAVFTWYAKRTAGNFNIDIKANGYTKLNRNTSTGINVNFNGLIIQGNGKCSFGNNFHSGPRCRIITINHNFNHGSTIPYDHTYIVKDVHIGDNVWLGFNVLILGGVTIGEGAIIQAGSVVVNDIPKFAIAGGHPAKVFAQRNIEHYNSLKNQGKFH